jgi:hypothetical protein
MASGNVIYPKYKEAILDSLTNADLNDNTVKVALLQATETYNAADDFLDDITAGAVIGTAQTLNNTTVTNGLFDADDVTFTAVSGAQVVTLLIYIDTGTPSTSRLVAWIDTGVTGLPVTPNGGNISITWNASGIFQL